MALPTSKSETRSNKTTPSHWPRDVQYLNSPRYHTSVPTTLRSHLCPSSSLSMRQGGNAARNPLVAVRPISDSAHPAKGQRGLFAAKKIPPRSHLIDYLGEVHCDQRPDSDYDLSLYRTQNGVSVGVDASRMGNEARFINDFRGVKCRPNAVFEEHRTATGELRMSVWSGNEVIKKGEEILVSYGKAWWNARMSERSIAGPS